MGEYRIFGSENSPYSIKVRAYFRYKGIPHAWIVKNGESMEEYSKYAKLPIVPTVATPDGQGWQDSTPIIEKMEALVPSPSIYPPGALLTFIAQLLEEFGDEWGNKWMFHFRWAREVDQIAVAGRLAAEMAGAPPDSDLANMIRERMTGRGFAVGSNERTAALIEADFKAAIRVLEAHFAFPRPFLLGGRPSFADFGLAPQVYQALIDPTAGAILEASAPRVAAWARAMVDPKGQGDFETWATLGRTLEPLLAEVVAPFLRWSQANAEAVQTGATEILVDLGDGRSWWQTVGGPQKYHAKTLRELRRKYEALPTEGGGKEEVDAVLRRCRCTAGLSPSDHGRLAVSAQL